MVLSIRSNLPYNKELQAPIMFRMGGDQMVSLKEWLSDSILWPKKDYPSLKPKRLDFLSDEEFGAEPEIIEDGNVFMKVTKNARRQDFKEVSESNFWELLKRRWPSITNNDVLTMASSTLQPYEQFTFEFFIYLVPAPQFVEGLRRATADRVHAAAAETRCINSGKGSILDPSPHHLAVHIARQPCGTSVTVPSGNTMQQAIALDTAGAAVDEEQNETEEDVVEVEVELFGIWMKIASSALQFELY